MLNENEFINSILPIPEVKELKEINIRERYYLEEKLSRELNINSLSFGMITKKYFELEFAKSDKILKLLDSDLLNEAKSLGVDIDNIIESIKSKNSIYQIVQEVFVPEKHRRLK